MGFKKSLYIVQTQNDDGSLIIKNTLTQKIIEIGANRIAEYQLLISDPNSGSQGEMFDLLQQYGFIVSDDTDETKIAEHIFNNAVYGNNTLELTILPTNACNFDCVYCYQKGTAGFMSEKTMDSILRYVNKNIHNHSGLIVSWFGGEPLLVKHTVVRMMKEFKKICQANRKPLYSNMTTNGYELDPDTFTELVKNHVRDFQITIDGPKEIHNKQRPHKTRDDSFEKIISNLLAIKKNNSRMFFRIAVRTNISTNLSYNLEDHVSWLIETFGNDPHFTIVWETVRDWGGEKIQKHKDLLCGSLEPYHWMDVLTNNGFVLNKGLEANHLAISLCTASKKNGYTVNYDGNVYKCTMAIGNPELDRINHIGKINENGDMEVNLDKMVKWVGRNQVKPDCLSCGHYPECMAVNCPLESQIRLKAHKCEEVYGEKYEYLLRNRATTQPIDRIV